MIKNQVSSQKFRQLNKLYSSRINSLVVFGPIGGLRIRRLHPPRKVKPPSAPPPPNKQKTKKSRHLMYNTKLHLMVKFGK